ncbi:MAG TPA: hypothetical protein VG938_01400 [Verrucomicrobiae bacterium]|jgi:hypothetical protein|nr:hypothetical protein [Verrucomicrobiae bacterium]
MKIAVCFVGVTRNFSKHTLDSIQRNLFDVVAKHDPHFKRFAHFNKIAELTNERSRENAVAIDPDEHKLLNCDVVEHTDQRLVDEQIDFEYLKQFGNLWEDNFGTLRNVLRQLYSLNAIADILERQNTKFDLVIYSRPCLRFFRPIEIPRTILPHTLYTPWFDRFRGLNDRFAMGDLETMLLFARRQSMARDFIAETGGPMGAENYLLWYTRKKGLRNRYLTSVTFGRVRADGTERAMKNEARQRLKFYFKRGLEVAGLRRV